MISLRDKNILVAYLQIFLKEYFPDARLFYSNGTSKIINDKTLRVTGIYDYTTYQVLACYMYATYPNEGYPRRMIWNEDPDKNSIQDYYYTGNDDAHKTAQELIEEFNSNSLELYPPNDPKIIISNEPSDKIEAIINENITVACAKGYNNVIAIPDRVLSYILREVVTPVSEIDEIFRMQKIMYAPNKVPSELVGTYDDMFMHNVEVMQKSFIDAYTFTEVEGTEEVHKVDLPDNYKGFKITGYVDPWTEVLYGS